MRDEFYGIDIENIHQYKIDIPNGTFSRNYNLNGKAYNVVYRTPKQKVALFEDDSAEVWQRIYEKNGLVETAYDYILKNGTFKRDPIIEAKEVLHTFVISLIDAGLIEKQKI